MKKNLKKTMDKENIIQGKEITKRETVYEGYNTIEKVTVTDGDNSFEREVIKSANSVAAIIKDVKKNKYIFIEQYRPAVEGKMVEIVAGKIDKGEKPEQALKREVMEETGYKVEFLTHVFDFYTTPGKTEEICSLFYVEVEEQINEGGGIDGEDIKIVEVEMLGLGGRIFFQDPMNMDMTEGKEEALIPPYQLIDSKSLIAVLWMENNNTLKDMSDVITKAKLRSL